MTVIKESGLEADSECFFTTAGIKPSALRSALANVLTGLEAPLPAGAEFKDKDGHVRKDFRVRRFAPTADQTLKSYSLPEQDVLPALPLPPEIIGHSTRIRAVRRAS